MSNQMPPRGCAVCAVLGDLAEIAQHELREGRWDDVEEALVQMRAYVENHAREASTGGT